MSEAKEDCESLLGELMPFVEELLGEHGEFYPVGAAMLKSKETSLLAAADETDNPPAEDLIAMFNESFREGAQNGEFLATCLAFDAISTQPDSDEQQSTIVCLLDHQDSYSIKVCFPYHFDDEKNLVIEEPFAVAGDHEIFGQPAN